MKKIKIIFFYFLKFEKFILKMILNLIFLNNSRIKYSLGLNINCTIFLKIMITNRRRGNQFKNI
jgi:hypothetical protein